jgi:hypothetical protein
VSKINAYASLVFSLIIFVPLLLIKREVINQDITVFGLLLAAPIVLQFGTLLTMFRLSKSNSGKFNIEELKAFKILIIGFYVLAIPIWLVVVGIGKPPTSVVFSSLFGLIFAFSDLLSLTGNLQTVQQLRHVVLIGFFMPLMIALVLSTYTVLLAHWIYILNPIAIFFICRAAIISKS